MGLKLPPKSTKSHEKPFYGLSTGEDIEYRTNIHSCEKLKHHFFEVSFQNKRKGCFDAALALVAARRLYLVILRFGEFF